MQSILKWWFLLTALLVGGAMIWSFVPVLVPLLGVTVMIGALVAAIVGLARWIERVRGVPGRE